MKTILICQSGEEVLEKFRYFVVGVPDEFDMDLLDESEVSDLLDELANEQGVEWEDSDTFGVDSMGLWAESTVDDADDLDNYPMITLTSEMLAKAEEEVE